VALLHSILVRGGGEGIRPDCKGRFALRHGALGRCDELWHQLWNQPDAKVVARGLERSSRGRENQGKATARERGYIAAMHAFYRKSFLRQLEEA